MPTTPSPQPPPTAAPATARRRLSVPLLASLALHALLLALLLRMPVTAVTGTPGAFIDVSLQAARPPALPAHPGATPPASPRAAAAAGGGLPLARTPPPASNAAEAALPAAPATGDDSNAGATAAPATATDTVTAAAPADSENRSGGDTGDGGNVLSLLCSERPLPAYPPLAAREGIAGHVDLNVHVGSDGRVAAAWVKRSSGSPRLDRAAVAAVMRWRCRAPTKDGQAADIVAAQRITFTPP